MADIKVVIQLQDTVERDEIKSLETPSYVNNASIQKTGEQLNNLSTKSNGVNMKSWANLTYKNGEYVGSLSLADGIVGGANTQLIEQYGYNGYVFGAVPESKQLTVTLEVVGKNIDSIIIYGDKTANQFPTKAYRDGNQNDIIYSDDPVWAIKFDQQSTSHTLTFLEWNRANYNACITYVAELKNELTLDKSYIKSIESLSQSTGQPKNIYYGVVPSSGSVEIIDIDGELYDMVNDGFIKNSNIAIECVANNKVFSSQISIDTNYNQNKVLELEMSDELNKLETLYYPGYKKSTQSKTLYDLFVDVIQSFNAKYDADFIDGYIVDSDIKRHLQNIVYLTPYISYNTYKNVLDNICNVAQLQMIWDKDNYPKFILANKKLDGTETVLSIPSKIQFNQSQKDMIVKNKVECVKYNGARVITQINKTFKTNTIDTSKYLPTEDKNVKITKQENEFFRGTSASVVMTQGARVESKVVSGSFEVEKRNEIQKLYKDIEVFVVGKRYSQLQYDQSLYKPDYNSQSYWEDAENSLIKYGIAVRSSEDLNELISSLSLTYNSLKSNGQKTLSVANNDSIVVTEYDDKYVVSYNIMVYAGSYYVEGGGQSLANSGGEIKIIKNITFSINGDIVNVEFEDVTTSIGDESSSNYFTLKENEMLQNSATINGESIGMFIGNDIISQYAEGISTAKITICCADIFDINGNKVKNWANGELVDVGDILRVEKDNLGNSRYKYANSTDMLFKVTGRKFRYSGVPMLDLELQEVKII